jgi:hypothetical protein
MPMPVEIRELHIRVAVSTPAAKQGPGARSKPATNGVAGDKDSIVADCVEQILDILKTGKER